MHVYRAAAYIIIKTWWPRVEVTSKLFSSNVSFHMYPYSLVCWPCRLTLIPSWPCMPWPARLMYPHIIIITLHDCSNVINVLLHFLVVCVPQMNLYSRIDFNNSECLNESDNHPFKHCLKPNSQYLESNCDKQLIVVLAFTQNVKLHTLQFVAPPDGRSSYWILINAQA